MSTVLTNQMTQVLPDYQVMRIKDIQAICGVNPKAASRIMKDVKEWLTELKGKPWDTVIYSQFKHYFALR